MSSPVVPVILNARAGEGHAQEVATRLAEAFAQHAIAVEVHVASNGAEIVQLARKALSQRPPMIVAAGGDGTVSAVASCVKGSGIAMAVVPMGTLNHFARDVGMPAEIDEAVAAIALGQRTGVDVGEVNDRLFVNNASLGIYPDIVRDRTRQQRRLGRGKYWAMLWATITVLRRSPFLQLRMEIDGQETHCRSPFVFIGNNDYVMEGFDIGKRSSLRDGRLSIYTTRRRSRWGLVRLALRALLGRLAQDADFAASAATRLRIDSRHGRLLVATDGEVSSMETPLEFRVLPRALDVILPRASA